MLCYKSMIIIFASHLLLDNQYYCVKIKGKIYESSINLYNVSL